MYKNETHHKYNYLMFLYCNIKDASIKSWSDRFCLSPKEFLRSEKIFSETVEDGCTSRTLFTALLQFGRFASCLFQNKRWSYDESMSSVNAIY